MSKKTDAISDLRGAAKEGGGAHLTLDAKMNGMQRFGEFLYERGFQVKGIDSIGTRHVAAFAADKMEAINRVTDPEIANKMVRTLHNQMSFIRTSLAAAGRADFAKNPAISNKELGIPKADRKGTNTAATPAEFKKAVDSMAARDPGMAAILRLERTLGLRGAEGMRAGPSLKTWEKALERGDRTVHVIYGTKGGRPRDSAPINKTEALAAVKAAMAVAKERGGKLLEGNLKQAGYKYKNEMSRHAEITGHQLRYSYAQEKQAQYRENYSPGEASSLVSADLGHGVDRLELIHGVYCQNSAD